MKALLVLAAAAGAILVFLLTSASANTALLSGYYPWLLGANALIAVAMLALVGIQLRRLWKDFKGGVFGSRLKTRLVLLLALMALLPGALVYAVSMQFAVRSIESWFNVRVDSALEGGLELGRSVLDALQSELLAKARAAALEVGDSPTASSTLLNRLREQSGAETAILLGGSGQVLASSSDTVGSLLPDVPSSPQQRQARLGRGFAVVDSTSGGGLMVRVLVPVSGYELGAEPRVLQLTQAVPAGIARSAENVAAAHRDYQELQLGREGIKRIYTLTLTLTLLLALFAAIALAFVFAERLARPLLILAEGTQAVAAGDFTPRSVVRSDDELGVLTQSFSKMTRQLDDARRETERHRQQVEAASAYLEGVLANLSAGVLAFDTELRLRAANRGAMAILREDLTDLENTPLAEWPRHGDFAAAVIAAFKERGQEWQQELELEAGGVKQVLLMRGSTLPDAGGGGTVVVFDDITQLISAQRSAAWGEVAQRLAHEIKNPLTPIQLSAERLQMKLADKLEPTSRAMLDRSIATIVTQVEAMKKMVNDFRDYAKSPPPQLASLDLDALVREVLVLYEATRPRVEAALAAGLPRVRGDANQLRQVLHNLIKNAVEALAEHGTPPSLFAGDGPRIQVSTRTEEHRVVLTVADNGPGFPPQILTRALEPYVTTKPRGTGLGLAIVRKIVDEHQGEIHVGNRSGGGAEISIRLPVAAIE
ncbi:MAG: HAMP domain-containing protein [Gammaproteobacteria bacterium]|nr:HAMP domain-containing protein [Gammaproteobacteria bacterium]MBU1644900.1 HAMP domain-containing protein [Gammaproteobacteria bacterium]MBU1971359.1 HAMP domain-containing protein [Gammaproteobacteria bacterium]